MNQPNPILFQRAEFVVVADIYGDPETQIDDLTGESYQDDGLIEEGVLLRTTMNISLSDEFREFYDIDTKKINHKWCTIIRNYPQQFISPQDPINRDHMETHIDEYRVIVAHTYDEVKKIYDDLALATADYIDSYKGKL